MELSFGRRYISGKAVTTVRVKSNQKQNLKDHVRIETTHGDIIVTDSFDVVDRQYVKKDAEGNVYELYVIENHVQQEERFTPEKQAAVNENFERQRGDIDYMAMVLDVELEV